MRLSNTWAQNCLIMPADKENQPATRRNLSHQQMMMWLGQQLDPDSPIYNMAFWIEIPTAIDESAFELAFRRIVDASETLRSSIKLEQGVPYFSISEKIEFDFPVVDFSDSSKDIELWCNERCREMFNLEERMFASALLKLDNHRYGWYIAHHHLISDAWAGTQVLRVLSEEYSQIKAGRTESSVVLQPEFVSKKSTATKSTGIPNGSPLIFYGNNPRRVQSKCQRIPVVAQGDSASERLHKLVTSDDAKSFSSELSQFNITLTLLYAFLYRASGQRDLTVGVPFHNRLSSSERSTLGVFIELFPVSVEIEDNETFRTLFKKVQVAGNNYLRSATSANPTVGSNAEFNIVFNFIHARFGDFNSVPVTAKWLHPGHSERQFHMQMHVENFSTCNKPQVKFDLNESVFDHSLQKIAAEHFRSLLSAMSENLDQEIGSVNVLTRDERSQLQTLNSRTGNRTNLVLEQFDKSVARQPTAPAVKCGNDSVSYRQLSNRIDEIVSRISNLGIEFPGRVAFCLPRSIDAVAAIFAILKSGFAFVPIDPDWPQSRIKFVLDDCKTGCVVSRSQIEFSSPQKAIRLDLDVVDSPINNAVATAVKPSDTAYVLYTSGSTGSPKGVEVSHASLAHYVNWGVDFYGKGKSLSFPLFTPMTFDLTLTSIFVPLLSGGEIVVYRNQPGADIALLDVIEDDAVDVVKLTPSHLSLLEGRKLESSRIRQLILGGENLKIDAARKAFASFPPDLVIHNEYGPTEATVGCIVFSFDANKTIHGTSVPIGHPIPDMRAYVLNENLQQQPVGVAGELFLAGKGLAKGYFGQPELSVEKFISSPLPTEDRIYQTGDIVRINLDGVIEYLGRKDQQVKIRGARIELGAIEAALNEHPLVQRSVTSTFDLASQANPSQLLEKSIEGELANPHQGHRLVAYFTSDIEIPVDELNTFVSSRLPAFMLPSRFIRIDSIPMTNNGKVDFAKLPDPTATKVNTSEAFVPPANETEIKLAKIWCDVLRVPKVGTQDNFFDLGGDSILAIQIVARANRAGIRITPSHLFESLTVKKLAARWNTSDEKTLIDTEVKGVLTPIQRWALEHHPREGDYWTQSIEIKLPPDYDKEAIRESLVRLCNHHLALRTKVDVSSHQIIPLPPMTNDELVMYELNLTGLDEASTAERYDLIEKDLNDSLRFSSNIIFGAAIVQRSDQDHRLFLSANHMSVDAVSWQQIVGDLEDVYSALIADKPIHLEQTHSQAAWSRVLAEAANSNETKSEMPYWQSAIGAPPPIKKPERLDRIAGDMKSVSATLSTQATEKLKRATMSNQVSLHEMLVTALARTLGDWAEQSEFRLLVERHGREPIDRKRDFSRTVGWFTTLSPIHIVIPENETDALMEIVSQLREQPRNGIGYGISRHFSNDTELQNTLATGSNEVVFNFLGQTQTDGRPFSVSRSLKLHRSPSLRQRSALEFNVIDDGSLRVDCEYDQHQFSEAEAQQLVNQFFSSVTTMTAGLSSSHAENVSDSYPLTPMQEGMLFHTISEPASGAYVDQIVLTLEGEVETNRLNESLQRVFSDSEALRTAFLWEKVDRPLQVVQANVEFPFEVLDWQTVDEHSRQQRLAALIANQKTTAFDIEEAPLIRTFLCRCSNRQSQLVIVFHHLVLDGWSTQSLIRMVLDEYENRSREKRANFRFRDYVEWLESQDHEAASRFWKQELLGFDSPNDIGPTDKSSAVKKPANHVQSRHEVSFELSEKLREAARSERVTLNTLMQAVWAIIVSRYSNGDTDVVFGTTVAGRPLSLPNIEDGIGSFINTIPFRTQFDPELAIDEWLRRIQNRQAGYREWEFSSLVEIQKQSNISAGSNLFESILVFENYPSFEREPGQIAIQNLEHFEQSHYPLAFLVVPGQEIELILIVDQNRYSSEFAKQVLRHIEFLLDKICSKSSQTVGELLAALPAEQKSRLADWSGATTSGSNASVEQLIGEVALNSPEAVAVSFDGKHLTYDELIQQANQVATHLINAGLQPNEPVSLFVERSAEMIVGILGILNSGGYYVPLDVNYPQEHFRHVLEDTGARIVLTQRQHIEQLPESNNRQILLLDEIIASEACQEFTLLPQDTNRIAYAIYTSGSTGKPKGVLISHKNLTHSTLARSAYYSQDPSAFLLLSSFAFDSSVAGIFWTLCTGGTLVLPKPDSEKDVIELAKIVESEQVTHLLCLPALYQLLLEAATPRQLDSLQIAIVAGESVLRAVVQTHFQTLPNIELHNEYGPTEGTVWATVHSIQSPNQGDVIPIGKPIKNTRVILLDASGSHVPIGSIGEIYLAGDGVAIGYLNRPELTDERFVSVNNYRDSNERAYRTGDVGYYRDDGSLVFCGRVDRQIKIRGHRIELGEIESALLALDEVTDVVAVPHQEKENAAHRILAFFVGNAFDDHQTWTNRMREHLPEFMIPDLFIPVDQIPKLPNGKVDTGALTADISLRDRDNFVAPRNSIEEKLVGIWKEAIGLENLGVQDNFFSLGGDSIISIQIISRARRQGIVIQPRDIANHPTIASLAEVAITEFVGEDHDEAGIDVPLSPIQHWFFEREFANPNHWNQSQLFETHMDCDIDILEKAIVEVVGHHPMLNARFERRDAGWCQRIADSPSPIHIETIAHATENPNAFQNQCLELQRGLDITNGPLFKIVRLIGSGNKNDLLLFVVHHLVIDAVSWRILIDDIEFAYQDISQGKQVRLLNNHTSFARWTRQLEKLSCSQSVVTQLDSYLQTSTGINALPVDYQSTQVATEAVVEIASAICDESTTQSLRNEANAAYHTTTQDLLLAATSMTLGQWTGENDVLIEVESHGRSSSQTDLDTSRTVGWFTAVYPIRFEADWSDVSETVKAVKERQRIIADNGLGFGMLRHLNKATRDQLGDVTQPEFLFNYLGVESLPAESAVLRPIPGANESSRDGRNAKTVGLELNTVIRRGKLTVSLRYSPFQLKGETASRLVESFVDNLRSIVDHCLGREVGFTPSDFIESGLSQEELDEFLDDLD